MNLVAVGSGPVARREGETNTATCTTGTRAATHPLTPTTQPNNDIPTTLTTPC